jgi:hypothetical protein
MYGAAGVRLSLLRIAWKAADPLIEFPACAPMYPHARAPERRCEIVAINSFLVVP